TLLCGLAARFLARRAGSDTGEFGRILARATRERELGTRAANADEGESVPFFRWVRWILLAMVPSSLMLGVTTYVTTDVAPVAMLWIIPLTLFLLSFILVFRRLSGNLNYVLLALLIAAVIALVLPIKFSQFGDSLLRDVKLTNLLPLKLSPDLSDFLAVRHL